jgi:hypothetical protein
LELLESSLKRGEGALHPRKGLGLLGELGFSSGQGRSPSGLGSGQSRGIDCLGSSNRSGQGSGVRRGLGSDRSGDRRSHTRGTIGAIGRSLVGGPFVVSSPKGGLQSGSFSSLDRSHTG